jgi:uncharacterized protein YecE (DUF72 family)
VSATTLLVGTSGWQYDDWRGGLYPQHLAKGRWLEHYAAAFATVEVNNSFYRLPERATFERWAAAVPAGFVFAVKASRYLTHVRRLRDPEAPVARLVERLQGLGAACGPVLLQLPPNLPADAGSLDRALAAFAPGRRVAVEPRHPSWFTDEVCRVLERRGAALCLSDTHGRRPPLWRTADWGYVRLHAGNGAPAPTYATRALVSWVERVAGLWPRDAEVYCYFNNDHGGAAPHDAARLATAAARAGLEVTRTPRVADVPLTIG